MNLLEKCIFTLKRQFWIEGEFYIANLRPCFNIQPNRTYVLSICQDYRRHSLKRKDTYMDPRLAKSALAKEIFHKWLPQLLLVLNCMAVESAVFWRKGNTTWQHICSIILCNRKYCLINSLDSFLIIAAFTFALSKHRDLSLPNFLPKFSSEALCFFGGMETKI